VNESNNPELSGVTTKAALRSNTSDLYSGNAFLEIQSDHFVSGTRFPRFFYSSPNAYQKGNSNCVFTQNNLMLRDSPFVISTLRLVVSDAPTGCHTHLRLEA
jgi:hypothetical protein